MKNSSRLGKMPAWQRYFVLEVESERYRYRPVTANQGFRPNGEYAAAAVSRTRRANGRSVPTSRHRARVGSKVDSDDNDLTETINGLYKAEVIHRCGPWKTK